MTNKKHDISKYQTIEVQTPTDPKAIERIKQFMQEQLKNPRPVKIVPCNEPLPCREVNFDSDSYCNMCHEFGVVAVLRTLIVKRLIPQLPHEVQDTTSEIIHEWCSPEDEVRHPRPTLISAALINAEPVQLATQVERIPEAALVNELLRRMNEKEITPLSLELINEWINND